VGKAVGYYSRYDTALKQFIHPAGIVVLTPRGVVSGYVLGIGYQPGDLRAAVIRASSGGVEQAVQPVLLLCFHFDPTTGRYSLAIMKLLRLTGLLTVLTVLGVLLVLRRRERQA
jgi:protein SCO1/2